MVISCRIWRYFAVLGLFALVGCSKAEEVFDGLITQKSPLVCPRAEVIEQAASYTDFVSTLHGDVNGVRYNVSFVGLSGECTLDGDGNLRLDLYMRFLAQAGVALEDNALTTAPWFLVLLREDGERREVVARKSFDQAVALSRNGDLVPVRAHFTITVPEQTEQSVAGLQVLGGFVLDDAQWDFNEQNPFYFR
ncbi:MAG: hypothetical protein HRT36_06135 [Alphaproteobacteria bacterium]|nr:hypothetical protein [Alphaproteobacteria bacterium]